MPTWTPGWSIPFLAHATPVTYTAEREQMGGSFRNRTPFPKDLALGER